MIKAVTRADVLTTRIAAAGAGEFRIMERKDGDPFQALSSPPRASIDDAGKVGLYKLNPVGPLIA